MDGFKWYLCLSQDAHRLRLIPPHLYRETLKKFRAVFNIFLSTFYIISYFYVNSYFYINSYFYFNSYFCRLLDGTRINEVVSGGMIQVLTIVKFQNNLEKLHWNGEVILNSFWENNVSYNFKSYYQNSEKILKMGRNNFRGPLGSARMVCAINTGSLFALWMFAWKSSDTPFANSVLEPQCRRGAFVWTRH